MGFRSLMFAFIFLIDINIGSIDILPDFVAYFLFINGLRELKGESQYFESSLLISKILLGYSIVILGIKYLTGGELGGLTLILGIIFEVLALVMIYGIFKGTEEYANGRGARGIAKSASNLWYLYITSVISLWICVLVPIIGVVIFIPLFFFIIIVFIMCINLMSKASKI